MYSLSVESDIACKANMCVKSKWYIFHLRWCYDRTEETEPRLVDFMLSQRHRKPNLNLWDTHVIESIGLGWETVTICNQLRES